MNFSVPTILLASLFITSTTHAEKLTIVLPDASFGGTPSDYTSPILEERNWKPRPDFDVPLGTTNIAKGKKVTASVKKPEYGHFAMLVDGDKGYEEKSLVGLAKGLQWIQIDLGQPSNLYALTLWHRHLDEQVYFDTIIKIADDEGFTKNVRTVFNNDHDKSAKTEVGKDKEYIEDWRSRFVDLKKEKAQFIRFYSNGNTKDEFNHYVEAEVFGSPIK